MGAKERAKGLAGEKEVADIWRFYGLEVRNLEGTGDHLVLTHGTSHERPFTVHSEVKRQERLQLWQWLAQAEAEAPAGAVPVVSFRRSRGKWYACLPLEALAEMLA